MDISGFLSVAELGENNSILGARDAFYAALNDYLYAEIVENGVDCNNSYVTNWTEKVVDHVKRLIHTQINELKDLPNQDENQLAPNEIEKTLLEAHQIKETNYNTIVSDNDNCKSTKKNDSKAQSTVFISDVISAIRNSSEPHISTSSVDNINDKQAKELELISTKISKAPVGKTVEEKNEVYSIEEITSTSTSSLSSLVFMLTPTSGNNNNSHSKLNNKSNKSSIFSCMSCSPTPTPAFKQSKSIVISQRKNTTDEEKEGEHEEEQSKDLSLIYKSPNSTEKAVMFKIGDVLSDDESTTDELFKAQNLNAIDAKHEISKSIANNVDENEKKEPASLAYGELLSPIQDKKKRMKKERSKNSSDILAPTQLLTNEVIETVNKLSTGKELSSKIKLDKKLSNCSTAKLQPIAKFFPGVNAKSNNLDIIDEDSSSKLNKAQQLDKKRTVTTRKYLTARELGKIEANRTKKALKENIFINAYEAKTNKSKADNASSSQSSKNDILLLLKKAGDQQENSQLNEEKVYNESQENIIKRNNGIVVTNIVLSQTNGYSDKINHEDDDEIPFAVRHVINDINLHDFKDEIDENEVDSRRFSLLPKLPFNVPSQIRKKRVQQSLGTESSQSKALTQFQKEKEIEHSESEAVTPILSVLSSLDKIPKKVSLTESKCIISPPVNITTMENRKNQHKVCVNRPITLSADELSQSSEQFFSASGNSETADTLEGYQMLTCTNIKEKKNSMTVIHVDEKELPVAPIKTSVSKINQQQNEENPILNFEEYTISQLEYMMALIHKSYTGRDDAIQYLKAFTKAHNGKLPKIQYSKWQLTPKKKRDELCKMIFDWIIQSPWYILISTFVPIDEKRLHTDLKKAGIKVSFDFLRDYLETQGVLLAQVKFADGTTDPNELKLSKSRWKRRKKTSNFKNRKSKTRTTKSSDDDWSDTDNDLEQSEDDGLVILNNDRFNCIPKEPIIGDYIILNKTKQFTLDNFTEDTTGVIQGNKPNAKKSL